MSAAPDAPPFGAGATHCAASLGFTAVFSTPGVIHLTSWYATLRWSCPTAPSPTLGAACGGDISPARFSLVGAVTVGAGEERVTADSPMPRVPSPDDFRCFRPRRTPPSCHIVLMPSGNAGCTRKSTLPVPCGSQSPAGKPESQNRPVDSQITSHRKRSRTSSPWPVGLPARALQSAAQ